LPGPFRDESIPYRRYVVSLGAKHIQNHIGDFYGFTANWYSREMPIFDINMNPPLVSYYIAAVACPAD
jgi:hypothetical protein